MGRIVDRTSFLLYKYTVMKFLHFSFGSPNFITLIYLSALNYIG